MVGIEPTSSESKSDVLAFRRHPNKNLRFFTAWAVGIEPTRTELETVMLPLHYTHIHSGPDGIRTRLIHLDRVVISNDPRAREFKIRVDPWY